MTPTLIVLAWVTLGCMGVTAITKSDIRRGIPYTRGEVILLYLFFGIIAGPITFIISVGVAGIELVPERLKGWMGKEVRFGIPKKED